MKSCAYHPIERCELQHTMVRIDQTQRQCALEHHCPEWTVCPDGAYFTEVHEAYSSPMAWEHSGGTCI
jgi:hypothetical protein